MKTGDIRASGKRAQGEKGMTPARRRERRNMTEVAQECKGLTQISQGLARREGKEGKREAQGRIKG